MSYFKKYLIGISFGFFIKSMTSEQSQLLSIQSEIEPASPKERVRINRDFYIPIDISEDETQLFQNPITPTERSPLLKEVKKAGFCCSKDDVWVCVPSMIPVGMLGLLTLYFWLSGKV